MVWAQADLLVVGGGGEIPPWAPAVVPLVIYLIKVLFEKVIPDRIIKKLRDEFVPLLAPLVGVLVQSTTTGEVDWSGGAVVGLAGIGLHQVCKQVGIVKKKGK